MKTEILEIDGRFGEEYQGKYLFKEITWAKRNRIIQKHTKYNTVTGDVVSSDFISIQAETIMAALHGQPEGHPVTLERLLSDDVERGLPIEFGELLAKFANHVCGLTREETLFLSSASGEKGLTPPSQSSGLQKSSGGPPGSLPGSQQEPSSSSSSS